MAYEEKTEIRAKIDDVLMLDGFLDCIVHSHSDDVPDWYVEYSHNGDELEICLPSLTPKLLSVDKFNKHFHQTIDSNFENNSHYSSEIDEEISEIIHDAFDEIDFDIEIDFGDLATKLFENIIQKPKLLSSVLASGGVFLNVSQEKYARKVVDDFYLWQVESQIEFIIKEYRSKKSGSKYEIGIYCERDFKTTLNDFWHALDEGEDFVNLKERFLEYDYSEDGNIFDLGDDTLADQWLHGVGADYVEYRLIENFSFDSIVPGASPLIPGAVGYSHQEEDIYAFNRSIIYSKKRGAKSSLEIDEDDQIETTLHTAKLNLVFPVNEVADLFTKKNYAPSLEYIMCYWLQDRDLEETEIDWLVCAMSEFGESNIKSLISQLTKKYKNEEIPVDRFLVLSKKIPKKLLLQLNCMILKNLPKQRLWENVAKDRDGDFSVQGEIAILKMVCDHAGADVDVLWKQVSGTTFMEAIEYICNNKV